MGQKGFFNCESPGHALFFSSLLHRCTMDDQLGEELINILRKNKKSDYEEAFERAFELTKSYAGSANAQASAIPFVFEKLFELFVTGKTKT